MGLDLAGGILGGVADLGRIGLGIFQNIQGNKIDPQYSPYQKSPYAAQQLGIAQQLFNGRMFGANDLERNIAASQAGYQNNVNRNATDSSQALALGGLSQGITNNAYQDLQTKEQQNKYGLLNNLNQGYQAMVSEGDKEYQDKLLKYQIDLQQKNMLKNAAYSNIFGGVGDIAGGIIQYGNQSGIFGSNYGNNGYDYRNGYGSGGGSGMGGSESRYGG